METIDEISETVAHQYLQNMLQAAHVMNFPAQTNYISSLSVMPF